MHWFSAGKGVSSTMGQINQQTNRIYILYGGASPRDTEKKYGSTYGVYLSVQTRMLHIISPFQTFNV